MSEQQQIVMVAAEDHKHDHFGDYPALQKYIQDTWNERTVKKYAATKPFDCMVKDLPVHRVSTKGLFEIYLAALPEDHRQRYTCSCCHDFVRRFGGLVTVDKEGNVKSALWGEEAPGVHAAGFEAMARAVEKRIITYTASTKSHGKRDEVTTIGIPTKGGFDHMYFISNRVFNSGRVAESDFELFQNVVKLYDLATVKRALLTLKAEKIKHPHLFQHQLDTLLGVYTDLQAATNPRTRTNVLRYWFPEVTDSVLHISGTVVGELLKSDMSDSDCAKINAMTSSDRYMRPTEDSDNNEIEKANAITEELGTVESFKRRYARLEELNLHWKAPSDVPATQSVEPPSAGMFDALKKEEPAEGADILIDTVKPISFFKFMRDVLPTAKKVQVRLHPSILYPLTAVTTATVADAPPLLIHDSLEDRNPTCTFQQQRGGYRQAWSLETDMVDVTAIAKVTTTGAVVSDKENKVESVLLILDGCKPTTVLAEQFGLALFPVCVRREYLKVRRVIEEHSSKNKLTGLETATACGVRLGSARVVIFVTDDLGTISYVIDRFE